MVSPAGEPRADLARRLLGVPPASVLLCSDFDGTLAPITDRPQDARPLPRSLELIELLVGRLGHVAILSGRATGVLERLLPLPGLILLGDYGLAAPSPEDRAALDRFAAAIQDPLARLPGVWLERKPGSASVHYRDAPALGPEAVHLASRLAGAAGLAWRRGRLVVEVMPAAAAKEAALARLIEQLAPRAVIFSGDDTGDRGCFELLSRLDRPHLAVGVGSAEADPAIFTACDLVVDGPPGLASWLSLLADWAAGPGP